MLVKIKSAKWTAHEIINTDFISRISVYGSGAGACIWMNGNSEGISVEGDEWARIEPLLVVPAPVSTPAPQNSGSINLIASNRAWYHGLWDLFIAYEATLAGEEHEDAAKAIDEHLRAFSFSHIALSSDKAQVVPTPETVDAKWWSVFSGLVDQRNNANSPTSETLAWNALVDHVRTYRPATLPTDVVDAYRKYLRADEDAFDGDDAWRETRQALLSALAKHAPNSEVRS